MQTEYKFITFNYSNLQNAIQKRGRTVTFFVSKTTIQVNCGDGKPINRSIVLEGNAPLGLDDFRGKQNLASYHGPFDHFKIFGRIRT